KQALDGAEAQIKASSFLRQKQKKDFTKQIKDAREALLNDPEFNPKDELTDLFAALDGDQNKTNALNEETERCKGQGDSIAGSLDQMFHASGGIEVGSDFAY